MPDINTIHIIYTHYNPFDKSSHYDTIIRFSTLTMVIYVMETRFTEYNTTHITC